ncbi:DUF1648 domain-containing protein [Kitasatospora cineracea]|uniref:DUF1648 domain-containing protein n=1 Tax=Kitasatospora cineracea TaxID=88074 RepID=A0A3N4RH01_9ACTN|nr:DUF1648 domain-containing protein [Kitasatospora cineracea]ROR42175.1 hypothetical protein EDD39_0290 [Kitasatospora cineracea]RPE32688.1 hypothetical protein EDD38_0955 [Kitasatospora cineracea]
MNEQERERRSGPWWPTAWVAGSAVLTAVLPLGAGDRLPDPVATHWSGSTANGSMPFWAACLVPALIWAVLGATGLLALRRTDPLLRAWTTAGLLAGGVLFLGLQAAAVRANLDRADWHGARLPLGWFLGTLAAALLTGLAAGLLGRRGLARRAVPEAPAGPVLELPDGERLVWFSRAVNPWMRALAVLCGLLAAVVLPGAATGLVAPQPGWTLGAVLALAGLAVGACSSVRVRVSAAGLEVALGPLGLPTRRWTPDELGPARVEQRSAARAGGWGYRLNGLGTTVMLRSGPCLVVRIGATGHDFAVSVDDAERGAALLNALRARQSA